MDERKHNSDLKKTESGWAIEIQAMEEITNSINRTAIITPLDTSEQITNLAVAIIAVGLENPIGDVLVNNPLARRVEIAIENFDRQRDLGLVDIRGLQNQHRILNDRVLNQEVVLNRIAREMTEAEVAFQLERERNQNLLRQLRQYIFMGRIGGAMGLATLVLYRAYRLTNVRPSIREGFPPIEERQVAIVPVVPVEPPGIGRLIYD
jgi:hypothetical protein